MLGRRVVDVAVVSMRSQWC